MTGTSLDGLDTVLCEWRDNQLKVLQGRSDDLPADLRTELFALCQAGENEISRSQQAAWMLAGCYAQAVNGLLRSAGLNAQQICAIGCHGQTVRHHPQGDTPYTLQINQPARLAELTGIDCIADFRSRDIAAGGQGAPLVPAFHAQWVQNSRPTAIVNIGGMANISLINAHNTSGFDTGPGNVLMDLWCQQHQGQNYDKNGAWAASGTPVTELLTRMLAAPYFALPAPKSTGREHFNRQWLDQFSLTQYAAEDVQASLCELTVRSIVEQLPTPNPEQLIVCGGGAFNGHLMARLQALLPACAVQSSDKLGIAPQFVEAAAFAWLAAQFTERKAINVHHATGAKGPRILGALYPA